MTIPKRLEELLEEQQMLHTADVAGAISPNQYRSAYNMRKKPDDTSDKTPKKAPAPAPTSGAQAISQALGRK